MYMCTGVNVMGPGYESMRLCIYMFMTEFLSQRYVTTPPPLQTLICRTIHEL